MPDQVVIELIYIFLIVIQRLQLLISIPMCPNLVSVHFYAIPILHFKFFLFIRHFTIVSNNSH